MATLELKAQSGQIRQATDDLRRLEQQGSRTESGVNMLARAFVVLGGAAVIGQAIRSTAQFSQAIADLSAITGATGRDLQFYREQAAEIGRTTSLSASQAAEAFKLIASAQPDLLQNAQALAAVTREAVTLAEATGMTLPAAATALGGAINQFQLSANQANEVINVLAASSQLGTVGVESITESLVNAGAAANALGLDFAETVAGLQALARANITGARAGTSLNQVLLGLESTNDRELMPSINGLVDALDNLAKRQLTNNEIIAQFGREALPAVQALLAQRDAARSLNETIRGTNVASEQASTRLDTLAGDFLELKSAIEGLTIGVFGQDVESLNRTLVQAATGGVNALTENLDTLADVGIGLSIIFGTRLVASLGESVAGFVAKTGATITATNATAAAAAAEASYLRLVQGSLVAQLQSATTTAAQASLRAQLAVNTAALTAAQATANTTMTAGTVAAGALSRAYALLGGPVGVIALAAGALIYFAERAETSEQRALRLGDELVKLTGAFDGLTAAQLRNEYNAQAARAFVTLPAEIAMAKAEVEKYTKVIDEANRKQARGSGRDSQYAVQSEEAKKAQAEIDRLNAHIAQLTEQSLLAEKAVADLGDRMANLPSPANEAGDAIEGLGGKAGLADDKFNSLTQSLVGQIIELRDGANAAEEYALGLQLGADATDAQRAAAEGLLAALQKLRAERQADLESERERQRAASKLERDRELGRTIGLSQELLVAQQLNDQLIELERLKNEGLLTEQASYEERRAQLIADANERLASMQSETSLIDWESFSNQATGALAAVATGAMTGKDAIRGLAQSLANEAIGALIKLGIQSVATTLTASTAEQAAKATSVATTSATMAATTAAVLGAAGAATAAWTVPATLASIATLGGASAVGLAALTTALAGGVAASTAATGLSALASTGFSLAGGVAGRAVGGQVAQSSTYMVGERGPELFTPQTSGNITPFSQLMNEARNGQGGTEVLINVHNYESGETQVINRGFDPMQQKQIIDIVVGEARSGGRLQRAIISSTTANNRTS